MSAKYTYDEETGPRTVVTMGNLTVLAGKAPDGLTFGQFGGPLPDGRYVSDPDVPVLNPGARYILFFGPPSWFYSPIRHGLAFRVEQVGGRTIILGTDGRAVLTMSTNGITFGDTVVVNRGLQRDPLKPNPIDPAVSSASFSDLASAIDEPVFAAAATRAIIVRGARLGVPALSPLRRAHWHLSPGKPAPSN